jgi:hypothetical protein
MTAGLGEIVAPSDTLNLLLEPYCELVNLEVVYGPDRQHFTLEIPLEGFNTEVSQPCYGLPCFFPEIDEVLTYKIELPSFDIRWLEAIKQFGKYLNPPRKNNKRVTNSPPVPVSLTSQNFLALYLVAEHMHFDGLAGRIAGQVSGITQVMQALDILQDIITVGREDFEFLGTLLTMLSESLGSIPAHALRGIEMSRAILQVLEQAQPKEDPPAVLEWLRTIFVEFMAEPRYEEEIREILGLLKFSRPRSAFVAWCYSCALSEFEGDGRFAQYLPEFRLESIELLFGVPFDRITWLIGNLDREKNERRLLELICGWIEAHDGEEPMRMFEYAVSNRIFGFEKLSGAELGILLPLANRPWHAHVFDVITAEIKSSVTKWRSAVETQSRGELFELSWQRMLQAFDLLTPPQPSEGTRTSLVHDMRMAYQKMDSKFYHWIIKHRKEVTLDVVVQYLHLPSSGPSHERKQYRRLMLIDLLNGMDGDGTVHTMKVNVIREFDKWADFSGVIEGLAKKSRVTLQEKTLDYLKRHCTTPFIMGQFVHLLEKCVDPSAAVNYLLPINEWSVATCLAIAARADNYPNTMLAGLTGIVRLVLGVLPVTAVERAAHVIPFDRIFDGSGPVLLGDEDIAAFCFLAAPRAHTDANLVVWSHLSLRAATLLWPDILNDLFPVSFQFDIPGDSVLRRLRPAPHDISFERWADSPKIPPRPGTFINLASVRPRHALIYVLEFGTLDGDFLLRSLTNMLAYIDLAQLSRITFARSDTEFEPGWDVTVLYMPATAMHTYDFARLLEGIINYGGPLVMSARTAQVISTDYPQLWRRFFDNDYFPTLEFDDEFLDEVAWVSSSPTFLPRTTDLFAWRSRRGEDWFLHSIPFRAKGRYKWRVQLGWKSGRLIAASAVGTPVSFFNFDLAECGRIPYGDPSEKVANWIRFRQMALMLLSLMCESMAGLPFRSSALLQ